MENEMEATIMGSIGIIGYILPKAIFPLQPKSPNIISSFHFLFHYPNINPIFQILRGLGLQKADLTPYKARLDSELYQSKLEDPDETCTGTFLGVSRMSD